MTFHITVHYDNALGFGAPRLWTWYAGSDAPDDFAPTGSDAFGPVFDVDVRRQDFGFKFKDGPGQTGPWEGLHLDRRYSRYRSVSDSSDLTEIWCTAEKAFVYPVRPRPAEPDSAATFVAALDAGPGVFVPSTGQLSGLGATPLADGRVLFGVYHPNAARVYLMGSFNAWQRPGHDQPDPSKFVEMKLYRGYFDYPNTWLVTHPAAPGDEYKFFVVGGVPSDGGGRLQYFLTDPYARRLGPDFGVNNAIVVDPSTFAWTDAAWVSPDVSELIFYELSVYGFTEGDPDIPDAERGTFRGVTRRIRAGYFETLGVTALALMPLAEVKAQQGSTSLGYDPEAYCSVERDFGTPDDLRELVNAAHEHGLAVLLDQVFNHMTNDGNLLWQAILEHPDEQFRDREGGLYFEGTTDWGNRVDTSKEDVQNLLVDTCKLLLREYHVDGFRFDATHHDDYMDGRCLERLARELKGFKPNVVLVAENLPNQSDLNRQGFDGYAQWCDPFHDTIKALLREGPFSGTPNSPDRLGDIFFFCKNSFASHTNNVVNYSESHDETSVPFEVGTNSALDNPATKDRKGRLGLFASMVALGQPMVYMGQEFNVDRGSKLVSFTWPEPPASCGFFEWARRLVHLRRRYPGLKLHGYNPAETGQFTWVLGPWMAQNRGGGRRVIGWRAKPNGFAHDTLVVAMNFEGFDVQVDLDLGVPGVWVKLADVDRVNDIAPDGTNSASDSTALRTNDGTFGGFVLPSSSGFVYKWESA